MDILPRKPAYSQVRCLYEAPVAGLLIWKEVDDNDEDAKGDIGRGPATLGHLPLHTNICTMVAVRSNCMWLPGLHVSILL